MGGGDTSSAAARRTGDHSRGREEDRLRAGGRAPWQAAHASRPEWETRHRRARSARNSVRRGRSHSRSCATSSHHCFGDEALVGSQRVVWLRGRGGGPVVSGAARPLSRRRQRRDFRWLLESSWAVFGGLPVGGWVEGGRRRLLANGRGRGSAPVRRVRLMSWLAVRQAGSAGERGGCGRGSAVSGRASAAVADRMGCRQDRSVASYQLMRLRWEVVCHWLQWGQR